MVFVGKFMHGNSSLTHFVAHHALAPCLFQVFTVEMHHKRVDKAGPGDNVGMNIKGLDKGNMPRTGDVMILKSDTTLKPVKDFTAQVGTTTRFTHTQHGAPVL